MIGLPQFITLFFPVVIASIQIFSGIPKEIQDETKVSGAGLFQIFWKVELPMSASGLINLFGIIWALGWTTIIAAEMLGVRSGLGFRLLDFRYLLQYSQMLIYLIFMGCVGVFVDVFLKKINEKYQNRIY